MTSSNSEKNHEVTLVMRMTTLCGHRNKTANSEVATAIRLDSEFWFSKPPMGKGMMHSSKKTVYFFGNHEISNKLQEKVRLKIKAIILLGDSSQAHKAVFLHGIIFIEFLGKLKGGRIGMSRVDGYIQSIQSIEESQ